MQYHQFQHSNSQLPLHGQISLLSENFDIRWSFPYVTSYDKENVVHEINLKLTSIDLFLLQPLRRRKCCGTMRLT